MRSNLVSSVLIILAVSTWASGQKFVDKPYETWSRAQAMEILTDSGWARTYQNLTAAAAVDAREAARSQADNRLSGQERGRSDRSGGTPPVYARLRSAMPVRQALVRLNQIASNYDKMSETDKKKFDAMANGMLGCAICQSHYVVTMMMAPNSTGQFIEEGLFQGMTLEQMKDNIWLETDDGQRRSLVEFTAPTKRGDEAIFFFARQDEKGNLLVTDKTKELNVVFNNTFFNSSNRFASALPKRFDFKVSKLKFGNELMF